MARILHKFDTAGMTNNEIARMFLDVNHLKQAYYAEGLSKSLKWVIGMLNGKVKPIYYDDVIKLEELTEGLCDPRRW